MALFAVAACVSLRLDSATFDESVHLFSGVSYLQTGDFRLNPEHPPLAKMWAALPLVVRGVEPISITSGRWRQAREWELGFEFVNGPFDDLERRDPAARLGPARTMMVVLGLLLLAVIYFWSNEAWGAGGGLVSLGLAALSPTLLAHARLVTTDVPAALGFAATLWTFWRFCHRPSVIRALAVGGALGVALLLKYLTLLLVPTLIVALLIWVIRPPAGDSARWTRVRRLALGTAALTLAASMAFVMIWAAYGFRYRAPRTRDYDLNWSLVSIQPPMVAASLNLAREHRLLPEAYLYGVSYVLSNGDRKTFLNGHILPTGSRVYFPEMVLLKSTPAFLLLLGWLIWHALRTRWSFDGLWLAAAIGIYGLAAVLSSLNIGYRHLIPLEALVLVALGAIVPGALSRRGSAVALVALLALHAASSAQAFPRYLSYFNILGGGAGHGWAYAVDSNIDWGQDLRRLGDWTAAQHDPIIYLAYFGNADPTAYGIRFRKIVQIVDYEPWRPSAFPGPADYFAVSVTLLQGAYVGNPDVAAWLAHVRNEMTPIARAGDSILIYRMPA